jgi:DNA-directed RNA polymerase subunit D
MNIIENKKDKIVFSEKTDESLANAIRRSVAEITSLAIEEVTFFKNDSALYDEVLAHRLGLVPLENTNLTEIEKCSCKGKGCAKCTVELKLKAKGPCIVYSSELSGRVNPVFDKIPLVYLSEGQEIEFVAMARTGKGKQHSKFVPGFFYYRNMAQIEINKNCDSCKKCVEACPLKLISEENNKISVKNVYKCDLCEACVEECKKHGKEAINIKPSEELVLYIESYNSIKPKDIFSEAVKALNSNLQEVKKAFK